MKGRAMAVLAAMVVGMIGVGAVLFYAKGADARAVEDQQPRTIFVAKELVPTGTTAAAAVAKGLMVPTQIAAKGVPAGALSAVDATTGKLVALTDIAAGDFVVASRFGATPKGLTAIQVPAGQIAISVALTDPGRVGTFMTPGSRIVLYDTVVVAPSAGGAAAGAKVTRVLLDNVLVIAIGATSLTPAASTDGKPADGKPTEAAVGSLVTVALPPDTAAKLVHAIQTGTLYAGLSGTGSKIVPGQIVSDATLFSK